MPYYDSTTIARQITTDFPTQIHNRTFLITGPSPSSLGAEAALSLATQSPHTLILLSRSLPTLTPLIKQIHTINPSITIKPIHLDLASLSSVRLAAKQIIEDTDIKEIDVCILSAGVMACPYQRTEDGWEMHWQVNHLGHFLLTNLLLQYCKLARDARIVVVSSAGHLVQGVDFEKLEREVQNGEGKSDGVGYVEWLAYGQSKTANLLFVIELNRRLTVEGKGVRAIGCNPGAVDTGLQRYVTIEMREEGMKAWRKAGKGELVRKSLQQGCATYLRAALDVSLTEDGVTYLHDCQPESRPEELAAFAVNERNAKRCWVLSEKMVGEKFL